MLTSPLAAAPDNEELRPSRANGFCIEVAIYSDTTGVDC